MDLSGLEGVLLLTHFSIAGALKSPHWLLSGEEAQKLRAAIENVARHYEIGATQKAIDIVALVGAAGMVYGPRIGQSIFGARKASVKTEHKVDVTATEQPFFTFSSPSTKPGFTQ